MRTSDGQVREVWNRKCPARKPVVPHNCARGAVEVLETAVRLEAGLVLIQEPREKEKDK